MKALSVALIAVALIYQVPRTQDSVHLAAILIVGFLVTCAILGERTNPPCPTFLPFPPEEKR